MNLYVTPKSAFAWMVRIVVLEKRLENKIEFVRTVPGSDRCFFDPPQPKI